MMYRQHDRPNQLVGGSSSSLLLSTSTTAAMSNSNNNTNKQVGGGGIGLPILLPSTTTTTTTTTTTKASSSSYSPAQAEADRRRGVEETYTSPILTTSVKTLTSVTEFMSDFNRNQLEYESTFQRHLEEYKTDLGVLYDTLVPHEVPHKTFLQRYFFRCCHSMEQIQDELDKQQQQQQQQAVQQQQKQQAAMTPKEEEHGGIQMTNGTTDDDADNDDMKDDDGNVIVLSKASLAFHQQVIADANDASKNNHSNVRFRGVSSADPSCRAAWEVSEGARFNSNPQTPPVPYQRQETREFDPTNSADADGVGGDGVVTGPSLAVPVVSSSSAASTVLPILRGANGGGFQQRTIKSVLRNYGTTTNNSNDADVGLPQTPSQQSGDDSYGNKYITAVRPNTWRDTAEINKSMMGPTKIARFVQPLRPSNTSTSTFGTPPRVGARGPVDWDATVVPHSSQNPSSDCETDHDDDTDKHQQDQPQHNPLMDENRDVGGSTTAINPYQVVQRDDGGKEGLSMVQRIKSNIANGVNVSSRMNTADGPSSSADIQTASTATTVVDRPQGHTQQEVPSSTEGTVLQGEAPPVTSTTSTGTRRTTARDLISKLEGGTSVRSSSVGPRGGGPLPSSSGRAERRHSFRGGSSSLPATSTQSSASTIGRPENTGGGTSTSTTTTKTSGPPITQPHLRRNLTTRYVRSSSFSNRARGFSPARNEVIEQNPQQDPENNNPDRTKQENPQQLQNEEASKQQTDNLLDNATKANRTEPTPPAGEGIVSTRLQSWRSRDAQNSKGIPRRSFSLDNRRPPRRSPSNEALVKVSAAGSGAPATIIPTATGNTEGSIGIKKTAADSLAVKSVVRATRRRNLPETYVQTLESSQGEDPEIPAYLATFDLAERSDDIQIALAMYPDSVAVQHHDLTVTTQRVTEYDFWCRYFYRCDEKRILEDLRKKDDMGILGHSTRNLFQSINVKAEMNRKPPPHKEFSRGPRFDKGRINNNNIIKIDQESSSSATLDTVATAETVSTTVEQSGTRPDIVVVAVAGEDTTNSSSVKNNSAANCDVDRNRVGSIKEKLKNWSKVTTASNCSHVPQGTATERARRYRARRAVPARSQSLPAEAQPPTLRPAVRASGRS